MDTVTPETIEVWPDYDSAKEHIIHEYNTDVETNLQQLKEMSRDFVGLKFEPATTDVVLRTPVYFRDWSPATNNTVIRSITKSPLSWWLK